MEQHLLVNEASKQLVERLNLAGLLQASKKKKLSLIKMQARKAARKEAKKAEMKPRKGGMTTVSRKLNMSKTSD